MAGEGTDGVIRHLTGRKGKRCLQKEQTGERQCAIKRNWNQSALFTLVKVGKGEEFLEILPKNAEELELPLRTVLCQERQERRDGTGRELAPRRERLGQISEDSVRCLRP